jgi:microcystin-dependent protein
MPTPFLGEVKILSFSFAPQGWAMCNGQLMPVNQNQALFSLLGTMYGGDGQLNFALPDLRGRIPMHNGPGNSHTQGERGGEAAHTVTISELPTHTHVFSGTHNAADTVLPGGATYANVNGNTYAGPTNLTTIDPTTVATVGGSQPHNNMSPYLTLTFCIALTGVFPSQN